MKDQKQEAVTLDTAHHEISCASVMMVGAWAYFASGHLLIRLEDFYV